MAEFANAFHPAGVAAGISTVDVDEIYGSAIYRPTTTNYLGYITTTIPLCSRKSVLDTT